MNEDPIYLGFIASDICNTKEQLEPIKTIEDSLIYRLLANSAGHQYAYNMTVSMMINIIFSDRVNDLKLSLYSYIMSELDKEYKEYQDNIRRDSDCSNLWTQDIISSGKSYAHETSDRIDIEVQDKPTK